MGTENSEDSCACLTTCAMAAVSEDRTPPLSPPHCHSTTNSTTVCCGATPQHHHTGALPGEEEVRRVKNTDIQFATTITHCVMCHVITLPTSYLPISYYFTTT